MTADFVFPVSAEQLQLWFHPATFYKARAYFLAGKVVQLDYEADFSQIRSQVWGDGFSPFKQQIFLSERDGQLQLTDSCTCTEGSRCKHVLAALLKLKHQLDQLQQKAIQQPIRQLSQWFSEAEQYKAPEQPEQTDDLVLYELRPGSLGLQLLPKRVKQAKNGSYSKGKIIAQSELAGQIRPLWLAEQDYRLLQQFFAFDLRRQALLEDQWGYQLLQKMLETGRCVLDEERRDLSWGDNLRLELRWLKSKAGWQLLQLMPKDRELELVYTDPPCYLDLINNQLGILDTEISGRELKLLMRMPPVPAAVLPDSIKRLQQIFPTLNLPVPDDSALQKIESKPVPVLTLKLLAQKNKVSKAVAVLQMAYGPYLLPLDLQQTQTQLQLDDQTVFIRRHRDSEISALEKMSEYGLRCLPEAPSADGNYFDCGEGPENPLLWQPLLQAVPELKQQGWRIEQDKAFNQAVIHAKAYLEVTDQNTGGFGLAIQVEIDGQQIPLLPLITQWLRSYGLPAADQTLWLSLPQGKLPLPVSLIQPLIDTIVELLNLKKTPAELQLPDYKAALLPGPGAEEIRYLNAGRLQQLVTQLHHFDGIEEVSAPLSLKAQLRPYQLQGLSWLCFLRRFGLGGILADDMGLGKTVQTLAFLLHQQQAGLLKHPAFIVCPTSLLGNWAQEAARFAPSLKVLTVYGPKRQALFDQLEKYDLIVTSYPLLVRDLAYYQHHQFSLMALDEAQHIKNAGSQSAQSARQVKADFKLALTGTPLENHLGELKALFDFVLPGLLGTEARFQQVFRKPIEKSADAERAHALRQRIAPFMLRRTKKQVATELPDKTEILQLLEMESDQRNLYESIRLIMETKVRELFLRKGVAASQMEYLDALLKLRQVCCDARLLPIEQAQAVQHNAKLQWLRDTLPEMIEEGRKVLIFSQFSSMLSLIEQELQYLDISYSKLTGQTKKRQEQIDEFQQGENSVFLISLKAGGTGLNLTAADTVIHYDPWWNPAAENQATDRAYRIGQDKQVFVYKLIISKTVEEKVQQLQQFKQGLADQIFSLGQSHSWQGEAQDLLALFSEQ
jgi:superfamily II DNA or RNA helicase